MEYKGKLYGKVGNKYFPLLETADDVDSMRILIDKFLNYDKPVYNEAELIIIKDSIDRHLGKVIEGSKAKNNPITKDEVQFMTECNMHPHYYDGKVCAVKILTEDSEGSFLEPDNLLKLSGILIRFVNEGIEND